MQNNQIFIHVSPVSSNIKTGPIPVTTTSKNGKERAIIGFPAHGVQKKKAEKVFMMKREG